MSGDERYPFPFAEWKEAYGTVSCLKKTEDKETWLLEERQGTQRYILKIAKGEHAPFLKAEYELLKELLSERQLLEMTRLEFQSEGGSAYLIREYVYGTTLEELVEREGIQSFAEVAVLGKKLCGILAALHDRKPPVIHRDIKPENIVITGSGKIRLIDLGTARAFKPEQEKDTVCMGTRGYAAPEQFGFGQTDARSDIYAIGKVLLYLSTEGCEEENLELLRTRSEKRLKRIIQRCCAYEPQRRYQNVKQLCGKLDKLESFCEKGVWKKRVMAGFLGILTASVLWLGDQNLRLHREVRQMRAERETRKETVIESSDTAWNPYLYEESVAKIGQLFEEEAYQSMAWECWNLVEQLCQSKAIAEAEIVAYWELSGEELMEYQVQRMGYEYIADRMAFGNLQENKSLEQYEEGKDRIAAAIRECLEYAWIKEDGSQGRSVLYSYWVEGDSKNMDGCIIDLLDCMNRGLEQKE